VRLSQMKKESNFDVIERYSNWWRKKWCDFKRGNVF